MKRSRCREGFPGTRPTGLNGWVVSKFVIRALLVATVTLVIRPTTVGPRATVLAKTTAPGRAALIAEKKHYLRPTDPRLRELLPRAGSTNIVVKTTINGIPNTTIGSIATSLSDNPNHTMMATFSVLNQFADVCDWFDFHWVQAIDSDACPAKIANVVASLPVVDPPAYGWDYMYVDQNVDGMISADERNPGGTDPMAQPGFAADIDEELPWYQTETEEETDFTVCATYPVNDTPGFCPAMGVTSFRTYLVAEPRNEMSFCLLAGFSWSVKNAAGGNVGPAAITIGDADKTTVESALSNGNIDSWEVAKDCSLESTGVPVLNDVGLTMLVLSILVAAIWVLGRRGIA